MKFDGRLRARLVAAAIGLMGFLNVGSAVFVTSGAILLQQVLPPQITQGSRSLTLVSGFFLIAVAWNLAKRKRRAWLITVALLAASILSHLLEGLDVVAIAVALVLLGVLWLFRRDFTVRSDPKVARRLLFAAPYAILFFFTYAIAGFFILRNDFQPGFDFGLVLQEIVNLATLRGNVIYTPLTLQARWFAGSITLMTGVGILYIAFDAMRYVVQPESSAPSSRSMAATIIRAYDSSDLAYFKLGRDKSYFFNEDETCTVAYVVKSGVALVLGDPAGPPEDIDSTIRSFRSFCEENDWIPAFHSIPEASLPLYVREGFKAVKVGEEAFIDLQAFDLTGRAKHDLREALNRGKRENWSFKIFDHTIADENIVSQIKAISEEWLKEKFGGEMGFTMGQTPITGSDETLVTLATDANGCVLAFMTWAPMYRLGGWAGDFIRRTADAPHGVIDFLIVSTILELCERGYKSLSLGMAPLANVTLDDEETFRSLERVFELIYNRFNSVYHFKSLHEFKKKFEPRWENRYLVYPSLEALPVIIYAFLNVHLPNFSISEIEKLVHRII